MGLRRVAYQVVLEKHAAACIHLQLPGVHVLVVVMMWRRRRPCHYTDAALAAWWEDVVSSHEQYQQQVSVQSIHLQC